ncbi:MAG: hypothetical protein RL385_472 [Pseudomonadota bacterium]|jgi:uncharacterized protein YheU (UPF0270 family)
MATHIEVPLEALSPDAVAGLVDEFVSREGTDYGEHEYSLAEKCAQVLAQLRRKEVVVVFELATESTTLVTRRELARLELVEASENAEG